MASFTDQVSAYLGEDLSAYSSMIATELGNAAHTIKSTVLSTRPDYADAFLTIKTSTGDDVSVDRIIGAVSVVRDGVPCARVPNDVYVSSTNQSSIYYATKYTPVYVEVDSEVSISPTPTDDEPAFVTTPGDGVVDDANGAVSGFPQSLISAVPAYAAWKIGAYLSADIHAEIPTAPNLDQFSFSFVYTLPSRETIDALNLEDIDNFLPLVSDGETSIYDDIYATFSGISDINRSLVSFEAPTYEQKDIDFTLDVSSYIDSLTPIIGPVLSSEINFNASFSNVKFPTNNLEDLFKLPAEGVNSILDNVISLNKINYDVPASAVNPVDVTGAAWLDISDINVVVNDAITSFQSDISSIISMVESEGGSIRSLLTSVEISDEPLSIDDNNYGSVGRTLSPVVLPTLDSIDSFSNSVSYGDPIDDPTSPVGSIGKVIFDNVAFDAELDASNALNYASTGMAPLTDDLANNLPSWFSQFASQINDEMFSSIVGSYIPSIGSIKISDDETGDLGSIVVDDTNGGVSADIFNKIKEYIQSDEDTELALAQLEQLKQVINIYSLSLRKDEKNVDIENQALNRAIDEYNANINTQYTKIKANIDEVLAQNRVASERINGTITIRNQLLSELKEEFDSKLSVARVGIENAIKTLESDIANQRSELETETLSVQKERITADILTSNKKSEMDFEGLKIQNEKLRVDSEIAKARVFLDENIASQRSTFEAAVESYRGALDDWNAELQAKLEINKFNTNAVKLHFDMHMEKIAQRVSLYAQDLRGLIEVAATEVNKVAAELRGVSDNNQAQLQKAKLELDEALSKSRTNIDNIQSQINLALAVFETSIASRKEWLNLHVVKRDAELTTYVQEFDAYMKMIKSNFDHYRSLLEREIAVSNADKLQIDKLIAELNTEESRIKSDIASNDVILRQIESVIAANNLQLQWLSTDVSQNLDAYRAAISANAEVTKAVAISNAQELEDLRANIERRIASGEALVKHYDVMLKQHSAVVDHNAFKVKARLDDYLLRIQAYANDIQKASVELQGETARFTSEFESYRANIDAVIKGYELDVSENSNKRSSVERLRQVAYETYLSIVGSFIGIQPQAGGA